MKLYHYFRSTPSYRVRIALNIKNIDYEKVEIHLINNGGEQNSHQYREINPQGLVPCLETNGRIISQSLAIIEYLDEVYPNPSLLPKDPFDKATIKSLAFVVACEMHPLNNLRVLNRLKEQFHATESQVTEWYHHWLKTSFDAFETKLQSIPRSEPFCFGDTVSLADICLIPQVYNAHRFQFAMDNYPLINKINAHCLSLEAFKNAAPEMALT
jgi:maleylacetoacetate isomerase